uniref:Uncharacterized protein n=1 Tax=Anguilla anguilla TaxID=7936 RepID=A0A0E9XGV9_ANGAN
MLPMKIACARIKGCSKFETGSGNNF